MLTDATFESLPESLMHGSMHSILVTPFQKGEPKQMILFRAELTANLIKIILECAHGLHFQQEEDVEWIFPYVFIGIPFVNDQI